jgi:AcrR family transcriptional regulator
VDSDGDAPTEGDALVGGRLDVLGGVADDSGDGGLGEGVAVPHPASIRIDAVASSRRGKRRVRWAIPIISPPPRSTSRPTAGRPDHRDAGLGCQYGITRCCRKYGEDAQYGGEVTRRYELKKRAIAQAETRRRIVDATIELHRTVGPLAANISLIADRAGVSRVTVYRHFPDEVSLLSACTSDYNMAHPGPDPTPWIAIADPGVRLRTALTELYAYYGANEPMLANGMDSYGAMPALQQALVPMFEGMRQLQHLLAAGWKVDGRPGTLLGAAVGHAIAFATWRSIRHDQGLTNEQAVRLMVGLVVATTETARDEGPDVSG